MLQLSQMGSMLSAAEKAADSGGPEGRPGVEELINGLEGTDMAFSAELQAMLQRVSPEMLQRLEQMLRGGMSLPQAANSLLSERGLPPADSGFAQWLQQRLPDFQARLAGEMRTAGAELPPGFPAPATCATSPLRLGEAQLLPAPSIADSNAAQTTGAARLPQQLAGSLLQMGVPQGMGGRGWDGAIADRVMWMVQGDHQAAKLTLNPPHLGPLEVRISINQDQTAVTFLSQHAVVREALEAALPRLRELFDQQSMQLVRADIGDPRSRDGGHADSPGANGGAAGGGGAWTDVGDEHVEQAAGAALRTTTGHGLVDLFA